MSAQFLLIFVLVQPTRKPSVVTGKLPRTGNVYTPSLCHEQSRKRHGSRKIKILLQSRMIPINALAVCVQDLILAML